MKYKIGVPENFIPVGIKALLIILLTALFLSGCSQPAGSDTSLPPETPKNIAVTPGYKKLTVSWDAARDASSYEIFCGETAAVSGTDTPYRESQFTTVTLDQLENDQIYYIFVRSKNRAGSSALSSPAAGEPVLVAPAPSVIQIDGGLSVCWIADDGVFYEVLYSSGDDPETASVLDTGISFTATTAGITADITEVARITGLDNSIPYNVWIKAEADGKEVVSEMSSGIFAPVIPGRTVTGSSDYAMNVTVPTSPQGYMNAGQTLSKKGVFVEGRTTDIKSFYMAKYETTQKLWYEVQSWAESNGYSFQNRKNIPADTEKNKPVTGINWRDAVVWCNAYSEMSGLDPVYSSPGSAVLRDSRNSNAAACDGVVMDKTKGGFRLPTEVEREYAARGGDPEKADWMFLYAGSTNADDVAWYHGNSPYTIHEVGKLAANRLGIYDLSGNVQEWGWDWMNYSIDVTAATPLDGASYSLSFNQRSMAGGGVGSNITMSCVADRWSYIPGYSDPYVGFRIIRKAE